MNVIYSNEPIEQCLNVERESIFLAGPTPRDKQVLSWRPDAIEILKVRGYHGQVLVPERAWRGNEHVDYDNQVEWEHYGLENCTKIVFWVPRDIETMPAFTTNVEFGRYVASGRAWYGRPDAAPKNRYLDWLYKKYNGRPIYNDLYKLLHAI